MAKTTEQQPLIGRSTEIIQIRAALSALGKGHGGTLMLSGEPGIGKSTLAGHAAALAERKGAAVYWGFAWESGGAPPYWPWTQLLRSLAQEQKLSDQEKSSLSLILPEIAVESSASTDLQPDQARFLMLDSVRLLLSRISESTPLVLVFEDLHAADKDSLHLLNHLARHVNAVPIFIIATYRELEARASAHTAPLWQVGRSATVLNLRRLSPNEIAEYLRERTGARPDEREVHEWFDTTAGNPLFLSELVGLLDRSALDRAGVSRLPATIEQVILQQIDRLSDGARQLVSRVALIGKSFETESLAPVFSLTKDKLERLLDEASAAGILVPLGHGRLRFSHGLYRDVLNASLPPEERTFFHLQYADFLRDRVAAGDADGWSELATHLAAAGVEHREQAIEAWRYAADRSRSRLAFDEAAALLVKAVDSFGEGPRSDPQERCQLLLDCAEAMMLAGDIEKGHQRCREAFTIARTVEDTGLMCSAALTYGSAIVVAAVDQVLINMLQECLEALPRKEISMRARVQARLAAALQPAVDPGKPMDMAREAIAQAREHGESALLFDVLRSSISALMDFAPPEERRPLNEEFLALAVQAGDVPAQFRSHLRLMIDSGELADREAFDAAIDSAEQISERIGLPHYQWRVASCRAMQAIIEGRYASALHCIDHAQEMADRIDDLEPQVTLPIQRFAVLHDWDSEEAGTLEEIQAQLDSAYARGMEEAKFFIQPFISAFTVTKPQDARKLIENPGFLKRSFAGSDRFSIVAISLLATMAEDKALIQRAFETLLPHKYGCAGTGLLGSIWCGPVALELGRMARKLDKTQDAKPFFDIALELAERMESKPFIARIHLEHAELASECGDESAAERHEKTARQIFEALEMRSRIGMERTRPPATADNRFEIIPQGEVLKVIHNDQSALIKASKGLSMLTRLIQSPDTDMHVLDLSGGAPGNLADGDAGPALDPKARDAYKNRVRDLQEQLEEAESMEDISRAEDLREELEFISQELSRAFGLGGRQRPQGSAAERARVNVQRRLKDAIRRIEEQIPGAGRYLENTIKTGSYCRYSPM